MNDEVPSLTNQSVLNLLTPERQSELLKLLLKDRKFYVVVSESEDWNGIESVFVSLDDACKYCVSKLSETVIKDNAYKTLYEKKCMKIVSSWGITEKEVHIFEFCGDTGAAIPIVENDNK
jgi:hypothetical protein